VHCKLYDALNILNVHWSIHFNRDDNCMEHFETPQLHKSRNDFKLHWLPVKYGWIFDDGDCGATAFLYKSGMVEMHQLSGQWSDLPSDALSWLADKLIAFDDQIEEYWEVIMDDETPEDFCIHYDLGEVLTPFDDQKDNPKVIPK
jgi:hypothetical protein